MFGEEVVISDIGMDVPSDNYEEFDQEIDTARLGDRLQQLNRLKGSCRVFQFYREQYLLLEIQRGKQAPRQNFHVNLAWLSAEPEHLRSLRWQWLVAAAAALLVAAGFFWLGNNGIIPSLAGMAGAVLCISAGLIFGLIFLYQLRDEYLFHSHYAHTPLFVIENRRPSLDQFEDFFIQLQQRIEKAQSQISISQRLVGELKMCRRLKDEGIISEEDYTRARSHIFRHKQYKA